MKTIMVIGNVPSFVIIFRHELIVTLVEKGYKVYCLANGYNKEEEEIIKSWGAIPLNHELDVKGINPISDLIATFKLYKIFKSIKPDIVLASFVKPVIFSAFAAKFAGVKKKVGMIEGLGNAFTVYKSGLTKKARLLKQIQIMLYKLSLPLLDSVILLNNDDKTDLIEKEKIKVNNLHILGGIGVDLDKFAYSEPDISKSTTFLFIARLVQAKGINEFIEAAKIIKKKHPHSIFQVIGGLDENNPFSIGEETLQEYISDGLITYPGHVKNVPDWIKNSHVFVLPSYYREGVPRSTQEAMAIGRPIITTDVAGCRDTVIDEKNGFLIEPWNITQLVEKMEFFIKHPDKIKEMGIESRKMAEENFDVHEVNTRLIKTLEEI